MSTHKEYRFLDQDGNPLTKWRRIPAYGIAGEVRKVATDYPNAKRIDVEIRADDEDMPK